MPLISIYRRVPCLACTLMFLFTTYWGIQNTCAQLQHIVTCIRRNPHDFHMCSKHALPDQAGPAGGNTIFMTDMLDTLMRDPSMQHAVMCIIRDMQSIHEISIPAVTGTHGIFNFPDLPYMYICHVYHMEHMCRQQACVA